MPGTVEAVWARLQNLYNEHTPDKSFNPPASKADIEELEKKLDISLPDDFKESLRLHNGVNYFPTGELLSTVRIYDEWKVWADLLRDGVFEDKPFANIPYPEEWDGSVQNYLWKKQWIPIVSDCSGNGECLDLDPGETGVVGQVIHHYHDSDLRPRLANSFTEWLDGVANKIESGEYIVEDGYFTTK